MSLKTDYKDAVFPGNRKYDMIQNEDGTVSFVDVTEYTQNGDRFGAKDVNDANAAIIALQNEQLETKEEIKDINTNLNTKLNRSELLDKVYPIGSIYMSVNSANPSTLFGGTWQQISGRFLVGVGGGYSAGGTGGVETNRIYCDKDPRDFGVEHSQYLAGKLLISTTPKTDVILDNRPPYLAVYMWKRTA